MADSDNNRTLINDLKEGGYQGNFYSNPGFNPINQIYSINSLGNNHEGVCATISCYSEEGIVVIPHKEIGLSRILHDKRAPQDIVDKILA